MNEIPLTKMLHNFLKVKNPSHSETVRFLRIVFLLMAFLQGVIALVMTLILVWLEESFFGSREVFTTTRQTHPLVMWGLVGAALLNVPISFFIAEMFSQKVGRQGALGAVLALSVIGSSSLWLAAMGWLLRNSFAALMLIFIFLATCVLGLWLCNRYAKIALTAD